MIVWFNFNVRLVRVEEYTKMIFYKNSECHTEFVLIEREAINAVKTKK